MVDGLIAKSRKEAKSNGLARYFTGNSCANGHTSDRATVDGHCIECRPIRAAAHRARHAEEISARKKERYAANAEKERERQREKRSLNPEKYRAQSNAWRFANKERAAKAASEWREANREKCRAYAAAYQVKNKEKLRAQSIARYAANPEYHRERKAVAYAENPQKVKARTSAYQVNNPDKIIIFANRHKSRKFGAPGTHTQQEARLLLDAQSYKCAAPHCSADLRLVKKNLDHIIPLSRPELAPTNSIENLQYLCKRCNTSKSAMTMEEWLKSSRYSRRFNCDPMGAVSISEVSP